MGFFVQALEPMGFLLDAAAALFLGRKSSAQ